MSWKDTIQKEDVSDKKSSGGSWKDSIVKEEPKGILDQAGEMMGLDNGGLSLKDRAKPYVQDLPSYGAVVGGTIGGTAGAPMMGVGAVPGGFIGAGLGGAAGGALKGMINSAVYDEGPKSNMEAVTNVLSEGANGVAGEALGFAGGKALGAAGRGLVKASGELASIPAPAIKAFMERNPQVMDLVKKYGSDLSGAVNDIKGGWADKIKAFRGRQNATLEGAIENSNSSGSVHDILNSLQETLAKVDPEEAAHGETQKIIDKVSRIAQRPNPNGLIGAAGADVPAQDINTIKRILQDATNYDSGSLASNSVTNSGASNAASKARVLLENIEPEVAQANKNLSKVHQAKVGSNLNLFKKDAGAPESLITAGANPESKAAGDVRRMGEAVGEDFSSEAKDLAAAKYLGNAGLLPKIGTGRALLPLALGAFGAGNAGRQAMNGDYSDAAGSLALGALGSPLLLKKALQSRLLQERLLPEVSKIPMSLLSQEGIRALREKMGK